MNLQEQRAVTMIEGELARIEKSDFPGDEVLTGFIEANYAHGFIDEAQQRAFIEKGSNAVMRRLAALRAAKQDRQRRSLAQLQEAP